MAMDEDDKTIRRVYHEAKSMDNFAVIVTIIIIIILFVGVGYAVHYVVQVTSAPQKAAETFFDEISSGQITTAYNSFSPSYKFQGSLSDFEKLVSSTPAMSHFSSVSFYSTSVNGPGNELNIADLKGTIFTTDGEQFPLSMSELYEHGVWEVSALSLSGN